MTRVRLILACLLAVLVLVVGSVVFAPGASAAAPTALRTVSIGETSVRLAWNAVPGYSGQYKVYKDGVTSSAWNGTNTQETVSGLAKCKSYSFQVGTVTEKSAPFTVKTAGSCPVPAPTPAPSPAPPPPPSTGDPMPVGVAGPWVLKFQDEFSGDRLDTTKWASSWFGGGVMNKVSTPASNVKVHNGNAVLTMSSGSQGALITSNPKDAANPGFQFTTGYVEARVFFPGDPSRANGCYNWPAFWTTGQSWPGTGENDIAEPLSGTMTVNYHSAGPNSKNHGAVPGIWCGNGYHTFGLHRTATESKVYYDGKLVKRYATDEIAPQYLIFNVGYSSKNPVYGPLSQVYVDYARVWQ